MQSLNQMFSRYESKNPKNRRALTILAVLLIGFWLGTQFNDGMFFRTSRDWARQAKKYQYVVRLVASSYVDKPDFKAMGDGSIEGMLQALDPHSVYIPPREQTQISERFSGAFTGIGIQFEIRDDVITVVSPIPGTPADRVGLQSGDRIIKIDGVSAIGISYDKVFEKLRGETGTEVTITVQRVHEPAPFDLTLVRGTIPIHTVDASFLLADGITGYILINQFTAVTASELDAALFHLRQEGMRRLILDLRGNSGGYLEQAESVADRFLDGGRVIVSTRGRIRGSNEIRLSTDATTQPYMPLVILVDRGSASASEIVAGAIQDHDRGLIIGEPTFGKGLVQSPFMLNDGSAVRITTARWYTPSGRCVQRPYDKGYGDYYMDALGARDSLDQGNDSTLSEKYFTKMGRVVYANRGIDPDIVVPPGDLSLYAVKLMRKRVVIDCAREFADEMLEDPPPFEKFRDQWRPNQSQMKKLIASGEEKGVPFEQESWEQDRKYIVSQMKAEMAQRIYNGREFLWRILISEDAEVDTALSKFEDADRLWKQSLVAVNG